MQFTMYSGFSERIVKDGIEKAAQCAAEAGFTAVEFLEYLTGETSLIVPNLISAARIKKELSRQGLGVACYSAVANIWKNQTREQSFKQALEIAAELGAPYFHHTLLPWLKPPMDAPAFEDGIKMAIEAAAQVADYARSLGIVCIYEDQGRYINGVAGFGAFYWELKKICSNIGVCLDLGNILFVNERPETFLTAFKDEICHVHVKDYLRKNSAVSPGEMWLPGKDNQWLCETELGKGVVDIKRCMKLLISNGYAGGYSLETSDEEPFVENARRTMNYLRTIAVEN